MALMSSTEAAAAQARRSSTSVSQSTAAIPCLAASATTWLRIVARVSASMGVRLLALGYMVTGGLRDLSSNQATYLAHPLGRQLLVDNFLMTPGPRRGEPFAKLKSKVSKSKAAVLDSARTDSGL